MRKSLLVAALLAAGTAQALPSAAAMPLQKTVTADKEERKEKKTAGKREIIPDGLGGIICRVDVSRPPKLYGQHLQSLGKQKWVK